MIDFIVGLLFGKLILLNPVPFDVVTEYTLSLSKPVSAVTGGAHLVLEIPSSVVSSSPDFSSIVNGANALIPKGSVKAYISQSNGPVSVTMSYEKGPGEQGLARGGATLSVLLVPLSPVPTHVPFDRVRLISKNPLRSVTLQWSTAQQIGG